MKRTGIIGLALGLVLVAGLVVANKKTPAITVADNSAPPRTAPAAQVEQPAETPRLIIGDPGAQLTIIDYGDFQCPICARFFSQTEPQLRQAYIDNGKAKLEFRVETHIGAESVAAGEAAYCANDQWRFTAYHDELFRRQSGQNQGAFSNDNLKAMASRLGLGRQAFDDCLDRHKYRDTVARSHAEAQTKISGTPTFFIGSQKIVGAQPFSVFKTVIDAHLR